MNKTEFILALYKKLPSLPYKEIEERLTFYIEMIDDRMDREELSGSIDIKYEISLQGMAEGRNRLTIDVM